MKQYCFGIDIAETDRQTVLRNVDEVTAKAVIDPEIFIIGGGVSKAGQFLVDRIQSYYKKYLWCSFLSCVS